MKYIEPKDAWMYIRVPEGSFYKATHYTRIPSTDPGYEGWEDVIYLHESIVDPSGAIRKPEYVYILVNQSIPGMVKIGMTTSTVEERAKQINTATGVPTPWIPVFKFRCYGSRYLEHDVHQYLAKHRVNAHREMFDIDALTAQSVIERLGVPYANALYVATELNKDSLDNQE
jgi:hypothetical protein